MYKSFIYRLCTRVLFLGYVQEFIKSISQRSNLVAHQIIWNMEANMYTDEEGIEKVGKGGTYI